MAININKINVNFQDKTAIIDHQFGTYDQAGVFTPSSVTTQIVISEPAFTQMIQTLETNKALDMQAIMTTIQNMGSV